MITIWGRIFPRSLFADHRARASTAWRRGLSALLALIGLAGQPVASAEEGELILGVFPRRNPSEMVGMFTPLAQHLSRELVRPVRIETTPDFDSFWNAIATKRYHIVHYNQYHYLRSHKEFGYRVVAKNEEGGRSTISGAILVRKDSGIRSLQDLRGKTIVFGGNRHAMNSYIVPTYMLRQAGLNAGDYQEEFAVNPPNVALAVFFRRAVAGGLGDIVYDTPFVRDKVDVHQLEIIAKSNPLAHLPWAVRGDVDPTLRERIGRALTGIKNHSEGARILQSAALTDIVPADDEEFDDVRRIIETVVKERY